MHTTKNYIKNIIRKVLNESSEELKKQLTNRELKKDAEKIAKTINDRGQNSYYTVDSGKPFKVLELAAEILVEAYKTGSGNYRLPNIGITMKINKDNIEDGLKILFDPSAESFGRFLDGSGLKVSQFLKDDDVFNNLINYTRANIKRKDVKEKYAEISGNDDTPSRIKYLIYNYLNDPKTTKSFFSYMRSGIANAVRAYAFKEKEKPMSYDNKIGDGDQDFSSKLKSPDQPSPESNSEGQNLLTKFSEHFFDIIKNRRINENLLAFYKLKTMVVSEYPMANTTKKRYDEMIQLYEKGLLEDSVMKYMDYRKNLILSKEKNAPSANFFKEDARQMYRHAIQSMPQARNIAKELGREGLAEYMVENLFGMPKRTKGYLVKYAFERANYTRMLEIMKKMGTSRNGLLSILEKIDTNQQEINNIMRKIDKDIVFEILEDENPIQKMIDFKLNLQTFKELLINVEGKGENEANDIIKGFIENFEGNMPKKIKKDVDNIFMGVNELPDEEENLNETNLKEAVENGSKFPSMELFNWVLKTV